MQSGEQVRTDASELRAKGVLAVLRIRGFKVFLLAAALLQASHAMLYVFGTLHWLGAGVDERTVGMLWSLGVVAEIGLFFMAGRLRGRGTDFASGAPMAASVTRNSASAASALALCPAASRSAATRRARSCRRIGSCIRITVRIRAFAARQRACASSPEALTTGMRLKDSRRRTQLNQRAGIRLQCRLLCLR